MNRVPSRLFLEPLSVILGSGGANAGTVNALGVVAHDRGYIDTGLSYATILAICSGN